MSFNEFLNQAWNDHATQAEQVAERLQDGMKLIEKNDQIPSMAHLVCHVMGEHLGNWEKGVQMLNQLKNSTHYQSDGESSKAIERAIASLEVAANKSRSLEQMPRSDQIRVLAIAASALSEQKNSERATQLFKSALDKAQSGIDKSDPANRALAVTSNNLACALEEKSSRSKSETDLMILAAHSGRKYWQIAGGWLETERAEYRLANTYLKAGDLTKALEHAQACLEIVQENNAPPLEMFFGYEALAQVEKARDNSIGFKKAVEQAKLYFSKLSDDDQKWCKGSLAKIVD